MWIVERWQEMKGERGGSGPLNYQNLRKTLKFLHLQKLQLNSITSIYCSFIKQKTLHNRCVASERFSANIKLTDDFDEWLFPGILQI